MPKILVCGKNQMRDLNQQQLLTTRNLCKEANIRTILSAASGKTRKRYMLEIVD